MSNTKRNWPEWYGNKKEFDDGFPERVERGLVSTPIADCRTDGTPHGWREVWGKGRKIAKKKRTKALRRQNKKIDFD